MKERGDVSIRWHLYAATPQGQGAGQPCSRPPAIGVMTVQTRMTPAQQCRRTPDREPRRRRHAVWFLKLVANRFGEFQKLMQVLVGLPFRSGRPFSTAPKVRWMKCDTGVAVAWRGNGGFAPAVFFECAARGRARAVTGVHFALL
jgi:hypothetical protein